MRAIWNILPALVIVGLAGCGRNGPITYPVTGRIALQSGEVSALDGSHIEVTLESDPLVRASGVIQPDGRFALQSQHGDILASGAVEGRYLARIILNDDDRARRRQAKAVLPDRYLQFKTSGWSFPVPTVGEISLLVSPR